jgi:hypothetical protein
MRKRGIFFSIDALIALIIILIVVLIAVPLYGDRQQNSELHIDVLTTLSSLKVGEIENQFVMDRIADGSITDLDKTILEQIGEFYVSNGSLTLARDLASSVLSDLETNENVGIWYGNVLIYSTNSTPYESAVDVDVARQFISGIGGQGNGSASGFSARAFLSNDLRNEFFFFGGYVGDGNLSARVSYNGVLNNVTLEGVIRTGDGSDFDVYVGDGNPVFVGSFASSVDEFTPVKYFLPIDQFSSGENFVYLRGEDIHIAGGFLKVSYQSEIPFQKANRYYFPGIEGLINLYDGFYVPGQLNDLEIFLHLNTSFNSFLNIGNVTVFDSPTVDEQTFTITDGELSSILGDYTSLSLTTLPLRLGLGNLSDLLNQSGDADVISVTDLSGSMCGACQGGGFFCCLVNGGCSFNELVCQDTCGGDCTAGINEAKEANDIFIDLLLNNSANRVGLSGYEDQAFEEDFHELSIDSSSLHAQVDEWRAVESTCICCGINKGLRGVIGDEGKLIAYYPLNGDVLDYSGNGNNIVLNSGSGIIGGIEGSGSNFNGGDFIELPQVATNVEGSLSFWVNVDDFSGNHTFFDMSTGVNTQDIYFYVAIVNGDLRFWFENEEDVDFREIEYDVSGETAGVWHHVVVSWNFGDAPSAELYFDNVLVDSDNTITGNIPYGLTPYMGTQRPNNVGTGDLDGQLDEIRFYDKVLTPTEVSGLFDTSSSCGNGAIEVGEVCDDDSRVCSANGEVGNQNCNSACDGYDSCVEVVDDRDDVLVVMSDGQANRRCPLQGLGASTDDAIEAACNAYDDYGVTVHTVGFGGGADTDTLISIADCGNGTFYSADINDIVQIYQNISEDILEALFDEQGLEVIGNVHTELYPDSYIEFNYSSGVPPFGLILTAESLFNDDTFGTFNIPNGSEVLDLRAISYSGARWTDTVDINGNVVYNLSNYGDEYINLGDPYSVNIPENLALEENIVSIITGVSPENKSVGSDDNKIIYTLLKNATSFSPIKSSAVGCIWTIEFEDNTNITIPVPLGYAETEECYYTSDPVTFFDPVVSNDAFQIATFNLLKELDFDDDHLVDVVFTAQDLEISTSEIVGIPYTFYTEVQVRIWK